MVFEVPLVTIRKFKIVKVFKFKMVFVHPMQSPLCAMVVPKRRSHVIKPQRTFGPVDTSSR